MARMITVEGHTFDYDEILDIDSTGELARPEEWKAGILVYLNDGTCFNLTTVDLEDLTAMANEIGPGRVTQ